MFYVGLDLGQAADHTALAVIEEPIYCPPLGGWVSGGALPLDLRDIYPRVRRSWAAQAPGLAPLWLKLLHRYPNRTPYTTIVSDVLRRLGTKPRDDMELVVDATGVGAAVVDLFRFSPLPCDLHPIVITAGQRQDGNHVPKKDLIDAVQVAFDSGRITVAYQDDIIKTWLHEMRTYTRKVTDAKNVTYNARADSDHDDLVLACALAVWRRTHTNRGE